MGGALHAQALLTARGFTHNVASGEPGPDSILLWTRYVAANGEPPEDRPFVLHTCDNRPCVNPAHLYAGTHQQNMDDKVARDRQARQRGEDAPAAKLTVAQVYEVRALVAAGQAQPGGLEGGVEGRCLGVALRGLLGGGLVLEPLGLDQQQSVVFRHAVRAAQRAGLDLPAIGGDGEVGDGRVLGLAGAVRHHGGVAGLARDLAADRLRLGSESEPAFGERALGDEATEAEWDRVIDVNLKGTFFACRYAIPALEKTGGLIVRTVAAVVLEGGQQAG